MRLAPEENRIVEVVVGAVTVAERLTCVEEKRVLHAGGAAEVLELQELGDGQH